MLCLPDTMKVPDEVVPTIPTDHATGVLLHRCPHFYLCFRFCGIMQLFPSARLHVLPLRVDAGFGVESATGESCDEDVGEVHVVDWKSGSTTMSL